jgi:Domain of unknown function (DUF4055)
MALAMVGIDEYAEDFSASKGEIELVSNLMAGTSALRRAGEKYLPAYEGETKKSHDVRVSTAVLKNIYMDALRNISSRPFGRDIQIKGADSLPLENVTRNGISFQEFCRSAFMYSIAFGESFVLCEFPKTNGVKTLEEMRAEKIQPYLTKVSPLNVLDYIEENGECSVFRVATSRIDLDESYKKRSINQITVYRPGQIDIWEQDKDQKWFLRETIETGLNFVPVTRIAIGEEFDGRRPVSPLIDCAYAQIEHYQMGVALRNNLDMTAYPMLAGQGMQSTNEPVPTGPGAVLYTGQDGSWALLEPSGTSYRSLQDRLNAIEREIMILGLQPLLPQAGNIAALVGEIQASKAHAAIKAWAITLEEKMEQMLHQMSAWLDQSNEIEVSIDTDFGLSESSMAEVSQLLVAFKEGAIDSKSLLSELIKRNFITGASAPAAKPQPAGASGES